MPMTAKGSSADQLPKADLSQAIYGKAVQAAKERVNRRRMDQCSFICDSIASSDLSLPEALRVPGNAALAR